jgi:hypothetical protein
MDRTANCCSHGGCWFTLAMILKKSLSRNKLAVMPPIIWYDGQTMKFALRVSREAQEDQGFIFLVCVCVCTIFLCPCLLGLGFSFVHVCWV